MERRFAVHASADPEALIRHRAWRAWTLVVAAAVIAVAVPAEAKPKRRDAKAAFDRGVAAYKKANFEAAAEALGKSFELERDVDTLFAWAQAERKLDRCDKAVELYDKLLTFDLPPANHDAVVAKLAECRDLAAQPKPAPEPVAVAPPVAAPRVEPKPRPEPPPVEVAAVVAPSRPVAEPRPIANVWYKDPIALTLLGSGLAGVGVGTALLISAKSLDNTVVTAPTSTEAKSRADTAKSRGTIGLITASSGGALVLGGVVWILVHRDGSEQRVVTGWLAPGGGGLAVTGAF